MSLKRALLLLMLLAVFALPVQGTSLSTDYYQFTHAATYYFDATFYGHPVYFPSWAQEHIWDRHVLGYERDYKYKTTFYPLGQYVGERKLPETMDGYDMVYLIEETIEYGHVDFSGDYAVVTYYLPYYQYREYGVSEMKVILEKEYYYGRVYFEVMTAYPVYGPEVAVYLNHHWVN
ncbi:hypothetical protein [Thermococcus sp. AM4]|uniref:hypothetical protein n=1 Tax=Thermococcus sp. (strain AM4) TaxID=246969 RepID=UPI0013052A0D|nr:hypothetical protein [Thermococcus sp. AM4]